MTNVLRFKGRVFSTTAEIREKLSIDFESAAEWRRRKADEYLDDARNLAAAECLDHLRATVSAIPDGLLRQYESAFPWDDDELADEAILQQQWLLGAVGFHFTPDSAAEFVQEFLDACAQQRKRVAGHA